MTSFGWKKKATRLPVSEVSNVLDEDEDTEPFEEDWHCLVKRPKVMPLEDSMVKSERLVKEGELLAEEERYWEAIRRWDDALELTPDMETVHEMKSQALLELGELFRAIQAAERAVMINPCWPYAYQTLGRAQMNYGEVDMAIKSFIRAVHINPAMEDVWQEDLAWALRIKAEKIVRIAKQKSIK